MLYRHRMEKTQTAPLNVGEARDRVAVMADGKPLATLYRGAGQHKTAPLALTQGQTLDLLVENMGRINFGAKLVDERKGLIRGVELGDDEVSKWQMYSLPLQDLSGLKFGKANPAPGPMFWRGHFAVSKVGDTFIDMRGWNYGQVWVNGHHLGRYWKVGPQQSLYLPGTWLHPGKNEIIVLDGEAGARHSVQGVTDPVFETH